MRRWRRRKCMHCQELFRADPRSRGRQRYCSQPDCRKASHRQAQSRWLSQPSNRDYFCGPAHVHRVRIWRQKHPDAHCKRIKAMALQDESLTQSIEIDDESVTLASRALQDALSLQPPILVGLIATLTGNALQDSIVTTARQWIRLGEDILKGGYDGKAGVGARTGTGGTASV